MTDDLSNPCHPVHLLARSQYLSSTRFPSCFWSSSLPFPWNSRPQHFPQYVFISHRLSVIFLEASATLDVSRMCSFLILSLCVQEAVATAEKLYGGATTLLLAQTHQALATALRVLDADAPSGSDEHYREAVTALNMARDVLPSDHPLLALFKFTLGETNCMFP